MSLPTLVAEAVREYGRRLRTVFGARVADVVVFGSVARGDAHEDSDVDVLVLLDGPTFAERRCAIDIGGSIGIEMRLPIAPVVLSCEEWQDLTKRERCFAREVEQDGQRP